MAVTVKKDGKNGNKPTVEDAQNALNKQDKGQDAGIQTEPESPESKEGDNPGSTTIPLGLKPLPIPNAEEIEQSAQMLSENADLLAACRKSVLRADAIIAAKNAPAPKSPEEMAVLNYDRLVKTYGKDFVTAQKGNNHSYFSRITWNNMQKGKNGWVEVTKKMPEVDAAGTAGTEETK